MTKWVYFMTLFVGAAVCIWLILLNARTATESSSAALELERSENDLTDLKERIRKAESERDAANRRVEQLQKEVAALTEQRTSDRQVLQDLWEMVLNNTRAKAALEAGTTEGTAIGLSAFDLPLSHMGMLRDMGNEAMAQADALAAAGQHDGALQIAEDIANIGGTLSSAGRFVVYDRVGMALQQSALERQRQIYEARADSSQVEKIDAQLQAINERASMIDVMGQTFGSVMANMTEQDLADYVDGPVLNGEFSTLQAMPEIAEALDQARQARESQTRQTPSP